MEHKIHQFWAVILLFIFVGMFITIIIVNLHPFTIKFEMDNNTLEAVKLAINETHYQNENQKTVNNIPQTYYNLTNVTYYYNLSNISSINNYNCCYPRNCWNYNDSCNHNCEFMVYCGEWNIIK